MCAKAVSAIFDDDYAHSERGPSTASRWRRCPGSVRESRGLPDTAGLEAAIGTVFHDFAADCLELGLDPQGFVGDSMVVEGHGRLIFDQAMADNMLAGLDLLWAMADSPEAKMIVETRVSLEDWVGAGEFGTTDAAIIDVHGWRLVCFDWKYGAGVPVSPEWNDQAILYVLGTWSTFARGMFEQHLLDMAGQESSGAFLEGPWEDDIEVVVMIEQPRAPGGGGMWTTTMGEILREGERIRRDAKATEDPDAPLVPGTKQCQFCKAAKFNTCKARAAYLLDLAQQDFDEIEGQVGTEMVLPAAQAISPEVRSHILLHKSMLETWLKELHAAAYHDAEHGRPTPGMKLVPGRNPPRKWRDEKKAEILLTHDLKEAAFKKTLLSPAQVEEAIGKRAFKARYPRHVDTGQSKPILVPDGDKRDAIPDVLSDFDLIADDFDLV